MTRFGPLADPSRSAPPTPGAYWVLDGWLAAGPHPHADPVDRLGDLLDAGFDTFVNLTAQHIAGSTDRHLEDYTEAVTRRGGLVVDLPIQDMGVPGVGQAAAMLNVIDAALGDARRVYVHCWAGVGRTGTVVGCWLVRHGVDPDDAVATLDALRWGLAGDSPQTHEQVLFIEHWERHDRRLGEI